MSIPLYTIHMLLVFYLGEFGVVYKANFIVYNNGRGSMSVAVKTMQGILAMLNSVITAGLRNYVYLNSLL